MEEVKGYLKLDKSRQHDFLYPLIFQEYISAFAQDHRSVLLENVDVDYDKNFSFLLLKRLINRMYQQNHLALFTNANGSKQNAFWGHNKNLYSQMLSEGFSVIIEILFSLRLESSFEKKKLVKFQNLRSIHSLFPFLEDQLVHLTYVSDIEITPPIHLEILVQTLRYWVKDASSLHLVRFFLYKYNNWNSLITLNKYISIFFKRNPQFFLFLYNYHVCESESILGFLRNQSFHLRSTSFEVFFERIHFYGKIKKLIVEVFSIQTKVGLFKDPFIHYVRYQGTAFLGAKGTPFLMSKWKYYLINLWQCHFYVWVQPGRVHINQLSKHPFDFMGYLSNLGLILSVVRSQLLDNSFIINNGIKQLYIIVPIFYLIASLAKAKFCNLFGHPISKPAWTGSADSDIIDRFVWICRNLSHYYSGSSKKKGFYRIKYILRLSCARTLARKHKSTVRAFLKKLGSDLLEEFLMEEEQFLSLIVPRVMDTSRSLDRGRVWYLDIIFIKNIANHK